VCEGVAEHHEAGSVGELGEEAGGIETYGKGIIVEEFAELGDDGGVEGIGEGIGGDDAVDIRFVGGGGDDVGDEAVDLGGEGAGALGACASGAIDAAGHHAEGVNGVASHFLVGVIEELGEEGGGLGVGEPTKSFGKLSALEGIVEVRQSGGNGADGLVGGLLELLEDLQAVVAVLAEGVAGKDGHLLVAFDDERGGVCSFGSDQGREEQE